MTQLLFLRLILMRLKDTYFVRYLHLCFKKEACNNVFKSYLVWFY